MPVIVPIGFRLKWIAFRLWESTTGVCTATLVKSFPDGLYATLGTAPARVTTDIWENRVLEGIAVEDVPQLFTSLTAVVDLDNGASFGYARFMDMEVAYIPEPAP